MPPAAIGSGQIALGVGVRGTRQVRGEVRLARAAVDEADLHPASVTNPRAAA